MTDLLIPRLVAANTVTLADWAGRIVLFAESDAPL